MEESVSITIDKEVWDSIQKGIKFLPLKIEDIDKTSLDDFNHKIDDYEKAKKDLSIITHLLGEGILSKSNLCNIEGKVTITLTIEIK